MKLVDANVLLYAVNESSERHAESNQWLDSALNGVEPVGFAWLATLAFLRLSTKTGLFPHPLTVEDAILMVEGWMNQPSSLTVEPTPRHTAVLSGLLKELGTGGNLVSDAHLAALALEHGATVVTYDTDFSRFPGVKWQQPD